MTQHDADRAFRRMTDIGGSLDDIDLAAMAACIVSRAGGWPDARRAPMKTGRDLMDLAERMGRVPPVHLD